jgi:CHAD domain-containing protein
VTYRFEREEGTGEGVRRIVLERLEHAREQLEGELSKNPEDAVHTARKDLKKARAAIRLVRAELGKKGYRRDNDMLRDAGRELSDVRDAAVGTETLENLRNHFQANLTATQKRAFANALDTSAASTALEIPEREAAGALGLIEQGRREVEGWSLDEDGWALIGPGLKRAYSRGRTQLEHVETDPSPEAIHEWRKRVKDLWYHLRLVENAWPEVFAQLTAEAHEIANLLGDHHDLTALAGSLTDGSLGLTEPQQKSLLGLIEQRQLELTTAALPIGRRIYAEKPKAFARRVEAYWEAWRA